MAERAQGAKSLSVDVNRDAVLYVQCQGQRSLHLPRLAKFEIIALMNCWQVEGEFWLAS